MKSRIEEVVNRRFAIGGMVAATAALVIPGQVTIRAITQRGMVGGGLVKVEGREAQFSLFASRFTFVDDRSDVVVGSIHWSDPEGGYTLSGDDVSVYEIVDAAPERGEVRRIEGTMKVNDGESYPFTMTLIDAGLPGSGLDSIALVVGEGATTSKEATPGAGTGVIYVASGAVVIGDLQDVDMEISIGNLTAEASPGTPAS